MQEHEATALETSVPKVALVLTGGGARAAYQVGVLQGLVRQFPHASFDIVTGVSAGAINALFLASRGPDLERAVGELCDLWRRLRIEDVFRVDSISLVRHLLGWGVQLISGGSPASPRLRGLVDTTPLRRLLAEALPDRGDGVIAGVEENLARCRPMALAVTTLDYATGQTVTWVAGCDIPSWERPMRRSVRAAFTIDHALASAALPLLFPAVRLGDHWHGDGGMRLSAPLSPALHLGADRILAIATGHPKSFAEAQRPAVMGYPPPAQVLGQLLNAVFLDVIDDDALRLERSNAFLRDLPAGRRRGYRLVDLLVVRPSLDLGEVAAEHEHNLPRGFRFVTRGLGTKETSSPDLLSLLMFQPGYVRALMEIGAADAVARHDEIAALLGHTAMTEATETA
jgi:NTE family protein